MTSVSRRFKISILKTARPESGSGKKTPILLAGTAGGAIQTGMHYRSTTKENASHVPFTILNAMGVVTGEWGLDEGMVTSGVGALEL